MYDLIKYLHIASILGLMLVHPVTVAFHLKDERDDKRIRMLLEVTEAAGGMRGVFFGLVLVTGIALGVMAGYFGTFWIWASIVIFFAIGTVMGRYGRGSLARMRATKDDTEMERLLLRFRPEILAGVGTVGLLAILYLMMFKPTF